jgi:polyisoprenoid-binding protein YceI
METKSTIWVLDPTHTKINFKVKHLMITNITGTFREFEAEVATNEDDFSTAQINFSLNTASIDTEVADRDGHLKSPDFFDVENFPKITFKSTGVKDLGDDTYDVEGLLTIKGIEKQVKLNAEFAGVVKDPWGNEKAGFTLSGKINRKDWGLVWNVALETGGLLVGEDVKIICDVELSRKP